MTQLESHLTRTLIATLMLATSLAPAPAAAQGANTPAGLSLDSLLNTRISAASKYSQTADEAAASVTIVTADDIERNGYVNLGEVLEGVRGFYLSNDRNYQYLGTRGFSRPSDYNNRILVLVDGHTLNEHTWGSAQVGDDITLDLASIERIEIVRGPGSVLYGTNAMFAVINVVTKDAGALDGITVGARAATIGQRQASLSAGRSLGANTSFSVTGTYTQSEGERVYFPEFDAPEIARVDLSGTVLALHAWGQTDAARFGWFEPPPGWKLTMKTMAMAMTARLPRSVVARFTFGRRSV